MKVYKYLDKINLEKTTILLGSFESFHLGHNQLLIEAKKSKNPIGILLFDDYTKMISKHKYEFNTLKVKLEDLSLLPIDFAIVATFDNEFRNSSAQVFIDTLIQTCNVNEFVCGQDFEFGHNREWNGSKLKSYFSNIKIVPIFKINDVKLSTSRLYEDIQLGLIEEVNKYLVSPWRIKVQISNNEFKFSPKQLLPHPGIYYCKLDLNGLSFPILVKVGQKYNLIFQSVFQLEPIISFELYNLTFIKQKRIIIKKAEDFILKQEFDEMKAIFANKIKNI